MSRTPFLALGLGVLALAGCTTTGMIGEAPADRQEPDPLPPPPPFVAAPAQLNLLTPAQYRNAVRDIFGGDVTVGQPAPVDQREAGFFMVRTSTIVLAPDGANRYQEEASRIAAQLMAPGPIRERVMPCTPTGVVDDGCASQFLSRYGRLLYRRTLTEAELQRHLRLAREGARLPGIEDFYGGLEAAIMAQLQSPFFLYRHEIGEPLDGTSDTLVVNGAELASRLSFFLWNTTPDEALLDVAESGGLDTAEGLEREVRRMIEDERARAGIANFFSEMLELEKDGGVKDSVVFLHANAELAGDARRETLMTIEDHVFDQDADYRDLFTTRRTFVNRRLAALYAVPAPVIGDGFALYTHPDDSPRRGILGQASFLAPHASPTDASPTRRGAFVRAVLLCQEIPPPPANVETDLAGRSAELPLREQLSEHRDNPVCASCHALMDPIGFGFQHFDGIGQYRRVERQFLFDDQGNVARDEDTGDRLVAREHEIDASGELDGVAFESASELAEAIRNHPALPSCLVRSMYRYATSHADLPSEEAQLRELQRAFITGGYRIKELLVSVALSEGFRHANGLRGDDSGSDEERN
ncbi:MAG: DUF1592 domain-containing protein [Myxococcales bacterium]|nr:DUF1592 domain-containing protein [Myxococcales bacterium]MCB9629833.1 DUF1592 domain-containing protein [Sandaracinaceae bacterium]